jgi:hypothetical protein
MERIYTYLFAPIAFLLLIPFVLLFVFAFYMLTLFHALRAAIALLIRQEPLPETEISKPHFLERQTQDQTHSTT